MKEGEAVIAVRNWFANMASVPLRTPNWTSKYAGVEVSDLNRVRELETENAELERTYAELVLDCSAIKGMLNRELWSRPRSGRWG